MGWTNVRKESINPVNTTKAHCLVVLLTKIELLKAQNPML